MGGKMAKLDDFKQFVRKNSHLINYVNRNETTWQKLYEIWDLYGENNDVWNTYKSNQTANASTEFGLKDIVDSLRRINMDAVVKGLNGVQNLISIIQDTISSNKNNISSYDDYVPRPMYKNFDD